MVQDSPSRLSSSVAILVIVSAAAAALNLLFGHKLHVEPIGLFSFGVFCLGYGLIVASASRQQELKTAAVDAHPDSMPSESYPRIVAAERRTVPGQPVEKIRPRHALTIDLEDYFHTEVASEGVSFAEWENQPSRIEASTQRLLELLDNKQTQGTFFVLGWVAQRYPRLVHEIHQRGHEIGCHSLDHRLVCRMKATEFTDSTRIAKDLIESITGEPVLGYRAPCFSITPGCEWAFDALARLGFAYDSSVHPVDHPLYGNPTASRVPYAVAHGRLMEFPIATWKIAGRNLSVGGGAYLRLLPYQYIHRGLAAWENEMRSPAMLYLHPWEIDPYQPYLPLSFSSKVRQTWGTTTMEQKLERLLGEFHFAPVREVHRNLLQGKGRQPLKSSFQMEEVVEQVAG